MKRLALAPAALLLALLRPAAGAAPVSVSAVIQTDPLPASGNTATDTAVWVHPTQPSQSLVFATDAVIGGVHSYDLSGHTVQLVPDGVTRGIDVRNGFGLTGAKVPLVAWGGVSMGAFAVYTLDLDTRQLRNVAARSFNTGIVIVELAFYVSPVTGQFYVFVAGSAGEVQQWLLSDDQAGHVDAVKVRSFQVGSAAGGLMGDDLRGTLVVSLESAGLVRYPAEPDAGDVGTGIDNTDGGHLAPPVAGVDEYRLSDGGGYLVVSSAGDSTFAVYQPVPPFSFLGGLRVVPADGGSDAGIPGASLTHGLALSSVTLAAGLPGGLLVVHDALNASGPNLKLVPWASVARGFSPALSVEPAVPMDTDTDGGVSDAGLLDGGSRGGVTLPGPGGDNGVVASHSCGCGAADAAGASLLLVLVGLSRRRPVPVPPHEP